MSFKEVTALRRAGNLSEAYEMAKQDLSEEKSEWTYGAMFWVLRDYCLYFIQKAQNAKAQKCLDNMLIYLDRMDDLDGVARNAYQKMQKMLDPNVQIIQDLNEKSKQLGQEQDAYNSLKRLLQSGLSQAMHEDAGWIIYRFLKANVRIINFNDAIEAITLYLNLRNTRPSILHSQMLILTTQIKEKYTEFDLLSFIDEWGNCNFSFQDYHSSIYNGKEIAPLVDRIIEKCYSLGYTLQDVVNTFCSNEIDEERIFKCYSRYTFFDIDKLKEDRIDKMLDRISKYLEISNNLLIKNEYHSRILSYILWKLPENKTAYFPQMLEQWGIGNFRHEDWEKEENEKSVFPSLVERTIAKCIDAYKISHFENVSEDFELLLSEAIKKYPNNEQLLRNYGITLFFRNKKEDALNVYKSLLLQLNTYYVWKELAAITDDKRLKISALCKALIIEKNENFLGEIHLQLAELLIKENLYANAKEELKKYFDTYTKNSWRIADIYTQQMQLIPSDTIPTNNDDFYRSHLNVADEFVYSDIDWTHMVIIDIYIKEDDKKRCKKVRLCAENGLNVTINYAILREKIQQDITIGLCVDAKIVSKDDHYQCVLVRVSDLNISDVFNKIAGYIDYYNKEKQCYTILGHNHRRYIIYTHLKLDCQSYCLCYEIPEKEHDNNKPYKAIYSKTIEPIEAVSMFTYRTAVVDNVNEEKQLFHCVFNRGVDMIIHFRETILRPSVGDYVDIKYTLSINREGKRIRRMIAIAPAQYSKLELRKLDIQGTIRLNTNLYGNEFGFVEDYYIPPHLIKQQGNAIVEDGDLVSIDVLFNGEKWQAYHLKRVDKNQ